MSKKNLQERIERSPEIAKEMSELNCAQVQEVGVMKSFYANQMRPNEEKSVRLHLEHCDPNKCPRVYEEYEIHRGNIEFLNTLKGWRKYQPFPGRCFPGRQIGLYHQ